MPTLAEYFRVNSNLKANNMLLVMFEDVFENGVFENPPSYPKGGSCSSIVVLTGSLISAQFLNSDSWNRGIRRTPPGHHDFHLKPRTSLSAGDL